MGKRVQIAPGALPPLQDGKKKKQLAGSGPTPAEYAGRPGKGLWATLRRRYKVERALTAVNSDLNKLFGTNVDTEEDELHLSSPASKIDAQLKKKRFFVGPENRLRQAWDGMQVFLLCYVAFVIPLREGFGLLVETFSAEFWWEAFVDLYFICDIFLNFRTAIVDHNGALVLSSGKIARDYMTSRYSCCQSLGPGWFWLDVLACLPVSYVELVVSGTDASEGGDGSKVKAFKILRLLRLAKMLRIARLKRILQRYEEQFAVMHKISAFCTLKITISCVFYTRTHDFLHFYTENHDFLHFYTENHDFLTENDDL